MKILLVPWWLLLFGVSLNSGHYIRDAEYDPIYKIEEDSSGITFVNPKPEKPTLREILYYHIIERPREEPAITERSFTNSHGYQFLLPEALADEYDEKEQLLTENDDLEQENENHDLEKDEDTENESPETTTEARPLTNAEVKEAYKSRSYLFDQMRQRYAVKRQAIPDSLNRKKRQAEMKSIPEPPQLSGSRADIPKTYGMNLNPEGGYVWNNLNKPATYYELGPSNGNHNEGYESAQSQENMPPPSENAYIPPSGTSDSGSSEDIYVNTNRPSAIPLETEPEIASPEAVNNSEPANGNPVPSYENPEQSYENPVPNNSGANYPVEPITDRNNEGSSEDFANNPIGPEVYVNPEPSYPVEPIVENPGSIENANNAKPEVPPAEIPVNEDPAESVGEPVENPAYGYEQPAEEPKPESLPEESSEGDIIKKIPEAPTLPPLNYDNLPDYIRDTISSTEKPASYEQTDNPYINPQTNANDKKELQDIFATMTPVEEIPKTYGMNLTSDGGHVWNDMVNPPVSYDVGSPSQPEKEHKEEQTQAPLPEQPETHKEPENPILEPAEPEPIPNPEEPIQEPEPNENEEVKNPAVPSEPTNEEPIANPEESTPEEAVEEQKPEEPIVNPNPEIPEPNNEPEPEIPENEDNEPIEEPAEPEPAVEPVNPESEPGNEDNHSIELTEQPDDTEKPSEVNGGHLEEQNPAVQNPEEEKEKPDIMNELLKSEKFWKWLGEWTATYMELLEKHIRKIAIQEICNREKSGEQMCLLGDDSEDTGVVIKDGKVIVDGKEIEMTHTNNLNNDSELKRGSHNKKPDNKGSNGNKIEASTIYGNSVGNDKVTNVFIFTADKAEEVIDKLKPVNETEVDFVIDDRIKEEEKETNKDKSIEEIGTEESNTDDIKESNEGDKEQLSNEEANKSESNGDETIKEQITKEPEPIEESNVSEMVTEEVIKEEANKESVENSDSKPEIGEDSNVSESVTEEVIKEDANKDLAEKRDSKPERDADSGKKESSGDIEESDDDLNKEFSEKNINSKEYLEK